MGLSIMILGIILLIIALTVISPIVLISNYPERKKRPKTIAIVIISLFIIHWIFYLSSGYALLSDDTIDIIFNPIWITLIIASTISAISEFRNNIIFATITLGFTIISAILFVFITLIGNM